MTQGNAAREKNDWGSSTSSTFNDWAARRFIAPICVIFLDAPREFCDPLQGRHTRGVRSKDNVRRKFMSTPIRRIRSDRHLKDLRGHA